MDVSLNCKVTAVVAGVAAKKGEHMNFVKAAFDIRVDSDKAKEVFGSDFYRAAFGTMEFDIDDDGAEAPVFAYDSMTIKSSCGGHALKLFGYEHVVEPVIESVRPIKGERAVTMRISALFVANEDNREFNGALFQKFNTNVDLDFTARQGELFAKDASADDDDDDEDGGGNERVPARKKRAPNGVVVNAKGAFGNPVPTVVSG